MSKRRILVTGASGFLGSRICEYYKDSHIILAPKHKDMDITDEESVHKAFLTAAPDVVIHCAAISDTGSCEKNPEFSRKINVTGSENIAKASRMAEAKCLMCSSDQVYFGSTGTGAHTEDEKLDPVNTYGRQKLYAEQSCLDINPDCVILRLTWMYDPVSENPGEHGDFIRTLLANLREGRELSYPVHDMRGITYVRKVVENLEPAAALPGGIYNFGSENDSSTYDTVRKTLRRLSEELPSLYPSTHDRTGIRQTDLLSCALQNLTRNEDAFRTNPRNIRICTEKIRNRGILFPSTVEGLVQQLLCCIPLRSRSVCLQKTPRTADV